jgi:magnesium chelatase family protein
MTPAEVRDFCQAEEQAQGLLKTARKQLHPSARAFHRILKLGRTIADLENGDVIRANHLAEAIQYRPRRTV